jgi:hypothetical protein
VSLRTCVENNANLISISPPRTRIWGLNVNVLDEIVNGNVRNGEVPMTKMAFVKRTVWGYNRFLDGDAVNLKIFVHLRGPE